MANSHKRETARRTPPAAILAGGLATLATGAVVTLGVFGSSAPTGDLVATDSSQAAGSVADAAGRLPSISRGGGRQATSDFKPAATPVSKLDRLLRPSTVATAVKAARKKQWTAADLNLWTRPDDTAKQVGEIASGKQVLVTGRAFDGRVEIVVAGKARWVTDGYLSDDKPLAAASGLSMDPCPDPGVESGLTDGAVYVYRSVCHAFPQITSYGGWDNHGEHASGRAIDIMTSDVALGTAIAEFLRAHASELNLFDVIWRQHIWTPVRSGEGWRSMYDRGSSTANHYDHIHVSVN